jgi:type II secretory pathway pseudopilin PulG
MRHHDLRTEDGSILVVAIVLMSIMLSIALSSFAFVDGQQRRATEQRQRETSLNLAEGVIYAQGFALARSWPGNAAAGAAMPTVCKSSLVVTPCPDPRTLAAANSTTPASANFTNADALENVTWATRIRDNGGPLADAFDVTQMDAAQTTGAVTCPGPCKWDANGDLKMWVQAQAVVRGRPRNLVALLKREEFAESFGSNNAVTAGSFETTNSGNKTIIDVTGSQVVVRCAPVGPGCTDYETSKCQVQPAPISIPSTPRAMSAIQLERFKAAAQSANPSTYYTSCPASYAGRVVFVDLPSATNCTDVNGATYNSAANPGVLVMARGTMSMKSTYYGLVYMVNGPGNEAHLSSTVLTVAANGEIIGGLAIDSAGKLLAGQASHTRASIVFDPNAFNSLVSFGTTGLVQNTWRELTPMAAPAS